MSINQEAYGHSEDDFMPTPKAFKFSSVKGGYFDENLRKMLNENAIWLSKVDAFNDPMEMIVFSKKKEQEALLSNILFDFHRFVFSGACFDEATLSKNQQFLVTVICQAVGIGVDQLKVFLNVLKDDKKFEADPRHAVDFFNESGIDLVGIFAEQEEDVRERFINDTYVYCLTSDVSNLAMWSYYADNHQGIAVEFYRKSPVAVYSQHVTYTSNITWRSTMNFDFAVTKNVYWRHEAERRFIVHSPANRSEGDFIEGGNFYKFTPKSLQPSNDRLVKAIYFGVNTPDHDKSLVKEIVSKAPYPVSLMQSCISSAQYGLEYYQIKE